MELTRGDLADPAEAEHVAHIIGLPPLLVLERADNRPEDGELRAAQVGAQDIGECAEVIDIGEQVDGGGLHEAPTAGVAARPPGLWPGASR